ncbi:hypothetical protein Zmor_021130 [Zophobas morio]|uniref:Very long-chain fatty acid transport protein n=1 Tax=Zophobas morio TaxID=2755281 RepID=A0AA38I4P8_9CUCU|nr:hypothetical protein Zmor_021130 [Zophobas morio]
MEHFDTLVFSLYRLFFTLQAFLLILRIIKNLECRLIKRGASLGIQLEVCRFKQETVPKIFTRLALKHRDKIAFYFEDQTWTFRQVENFSNKVANFFKKRGYQRGHVTGLFLENSPEFVCFWLGLNKIGVVTALINTNLVEDPLLHSIRTVDPKCLIYGSTLKQAVRNISGKISHLELYEFFENGQNSLVLDGAENINFRLKKESEVSPTEEIKKGKNKDKLIFIYTSGTTGLPKAAILTNAKFIFMTVGLRAMSQLKEYDVLYVSLPLYHSAGGIGGVGQCLIGGTTVAVRKKFSASNFWKDCIKYKCTSAFYIGEICRYLLSEHSKNDTPIRHSVTKLIGLGLRPQIWNHFVSKFNIKEVYEFYGSTEGNTNLMNIDNKSGAVGYIPTWAKLFHPVSIIKCNMSTAEPIRGSDGYYQPCKPGEPGLFIGKVSFRKQMGRFDGYVNKKANEKKLLQNVFVNGDVYFDSGDILVQDEMGYFYFRDRMGDTFRWKGENVATSEVEAVISKILNLSDAVVYGVEVPGTEGKAGMVAIVPTTRTLDMKKFCENLKMNLPSYAVPLFVRVMKSVPLTGTFKLMKVDLRKEGFNVEKIQDELFIYDAINSTYVELTPNIYEGLITGNIRL